MSIIGATLPKVDLAAVTAGEEPPALAEREIMAWQGTPHFAKAERSNTIDIMDVIGEDFWGDGVSAKSVQSQLDSMAGQEVLVRVNSPGGSFYDGLAIYNALAAHSGKVQVHVLALAASAASVLIMAADEILMGEAAQIMIHEASAVSIGNKRQMAEAAAYLGAVDEIMVGIYAGRTGQTEAEIAAMIEAETFMSPKVAIDKKFADGMMVEKPAAERDRQTTARFQQARAKRVIENSLKIQGVGKAQRGEMLALAFGSARDAGADTTAERDAGIDELRAQAGELMALFKS